MFVFVCVFIYFVCVLFSGCMCFVLGHYFVQACLLHRSFPCGKLIINKNKSMVEGTLLHAVCC